MHVCAHGLYSPSYCDDIVTSMYFTHNDADITTGYCRASNLVFDLVLSPLFLILLMMLSSAKILSGAAFVNIML